jgi:hypothetical protein
MLNLGAAINLLLQRPRIVVASKSANWNSGVATSGQPGADLITVGKVNQWYRLNQAIVVMTGFNAAATVTVREYGLVAGVERLLLTDDWTMPQEIAFLSWWFDAEFYGPYRVEVYSDQAVDDGVAVASEYRVKDW